MARQRFQPSQQVIQTASKQLYKELQGDTKSTQLVNYDKTTPSLPKKLTGYLNA